MKRNAWMGLVVALGLLLAGCAPSAQAGITVTDAWARTSAMMERAGAAYMVLHNGSGETDRLVSATTPAAAVVEIHETTMVDGMMGMAPVAAVEVPAGGQTDLKPGGYHIMLIDLTQELNVGDTIELTLTFEKAGEVKVTAEVRDE